MILVVSVRKELVYNPLNSGNNYQQNSLIFRSVPMNDQFRMWFRVVGIWFLTLFIAASNRGVTLRAQAIPNIVVSAAVPSELNPPFNAAAGTGGAPNATPEQAAAFAWQEFIALNWPAGPQQGMPSQRETPSTACRFGDPACLGPTVWQTFRGKVEIFPGQGTPPGYVSDPTISFGYDVPPRYNYRLSIPACDPAQANEPTPWINLDETDQITLDSMYAGIVAPGSSPGNSAPQLIRFLAKANRMEYVYVAQNQWWFAIPTDVAAATRDYLKQHMASPPPGSAELVSQPNGTIEIKSAWRPLNPSEATSGRFHIQRVRFYEPLASDPSGACYRNATWGLVALHIIQKTPSAPYFIYATFEQADNLLTAAGASVEDADGNVKQPTPATATTPQVCLQDPRPKTGQSDMAMVILTGDPKTCIPLSTPSYCESPGKRLFYRNENIAEANPPPAPIGGNICVNKRDNDIPPYAINTNKAAHAAISAYLRKNKIKSAPWLDYKLVNVQYYPYDKKIPPVAPNGSLYTSTPPYTAKNPAASSFYQANIVVETNRSLQLFSGGLTIVPGNGVSTDWNDDGTPHKNTYYGGAFVNSGGCLGCHGSQGQNPPATSGFGPGDFSVILSRGSVTLPEYPSVPTPNGMSIVPRNRSLK